MTHWPNCPDCGQPLDISGDQSPCEFREEPGHGDQTWWDCKCGATWEDEELPMDACGILPR
jgi:hypothetical protein